MLSRRSSRRADDGELPCNRGSKHCSGRYAYEAPQTQYEIPDVTEELHPLAGAADGVPFVVPLWHSIVTLLDDNAEHVACCHTIK